MRKIFGILALTIAMAIAPLASALADYNRGGWTFIPNGGGTATMQIKDYATGVLATFVVSESYQCGTANTSLNRTYNVLRANINKPILYSLGHSCGNYQKFCFKNVNGSRACVTGLITSF